MKVPGKHAKVVRLHPEKNVHMESKHSRHSEIPSGVDGLERRVKRITTTTLGHRLKEAGKTALEAELTPEEIAFHEAQRLMRMKRRHAVPRHHVAQRGVRSFVSGRPHKLKNVVSNIDAYIQKKAKKSIHKVERFIDKETHKAKRHPKKKAHKKKDEEEDIASDVESDVEDVASKVKSAGRRLKKDVETSLRKGASKADQLIHEGAEEADDVWHDGEHEAGHLLHEGEEEADKLYDKGKADLDELLNNARARGRKLWYDTRHIRAKIDYDATLAAHEAEKAAREAEAEVAGLLKSSANTFDFDS